MIQEFSQIENLNNPIISIILPINAKNETQKTISSILNQTFNNFELLIVNYGNIEEIKKLFFSLKFREFFDMAL